MKIYPTPVSALVTYLEREKKAAVMRRKQCDKFMSKTLLLSVEEEVQNFVYKLRTKANEEFSIVLRLLSLIRYTFTLTVRPGYKVVHPTSKVCPRPLQDAQRTSGTHLATLTRKLTHFLTMVECSPGK